MSLFKKQFTIHVSHVSLNLYISQGVLLVVWGEGEMQGFYGKVK